MEYLKKEIRTFQNGKTVNDQFYIDDDYNVPDALQMKRYRSLQAWKEGFHLKK